MDTKDKTFNKAKLITQANASTELSYDANHNRAMQTIRNNGIKIEDGEDRYWVSRGKWGSFETKKRYIYVDNIETTYYSANGYEMVEEFKNNKTYKKFRINLTANGKQIGIYVKSLEGTNQEKAIDRLRYFHKDALGNIDLITDIDGKVVARQHYQAFGKRDQNLSDDVVIDEVKRGFTSHEHIDELGLINMNARLYDPQTARFLSADSFIQDSNLTLSHNRYIYVMNNPLKYTDPSGHFWNFIVGAIISYAASQSDNPFIRTLGMIAGGAMMGGAFGGESLFASTLHTKMAAGFVMGGINGGDAQGAILGAMSAGLTYGIGHGGEIDAITGETTSYFDSFVGTAVAHGTTQGIITEASGGEFKDGFKIGFTMSMASSAYSKVSKGYNKTGKAHLFQEGKADVGFQLTETELKKIANGTMEIPLGSDQSTFMKTIAKAPFMDAFGESHDGLFSKLVDFSVPRVIANIPTMPLAYALTVMAYSQPYTHYYLIDKYTRNDKEDER